MSMGMKPLYITSRQIVIVNNNSSIESINEINNVLNLINDNNLNLSTKLIDIQIITY